MKNREIKFRAWYSSDNIMINRTLHDRNWYTIDDGFVKCTHPNDAHFLKVMEYTGIKDKNGKEIYEGDILKYNLYEARQEEGDGEDVFGFYDTKVEVVKLINGGFQPLISGYKGNIEDRDWNHDDLYLFFEVIGNIYENPELIK
jgi:uncharacterized phage protein (TIGR01671 family)